MIFVTTVTCARNIYGKFTFFYIDTGGFTVERVTRASDNGDRLLPIKVSVVPLVNPRSLQGVFAYRLPALGCGWENLVSIFPFFDSLRFRVS
jgi:hypothetical protein